MAQDDVLITGTPRSGTTLTCHLLNKVRDTVALHEPMRVKEFAALESHAEIPDAIQAFCDAQRRSLHERGRTISKNVDGAVPDNPHGSEKGEGGLRKSRASKSEIAIDKPLSDDFTLVIKHNAAFTAVLGELVKRFRVYAVLRNPLAVMTSWNSIDFNAQRGHVPAGERLDHELRDALASLDDPLDRQVHILGWFHGQWHRHLPPENFVRYEDVVESRGRALGVIRPAAAELDEPLRSRNLSQLYDREMMLRVGERLLASDGAQWESYAKESVERLLEAQEAGAA
jgi:Sulfotransferase domain